MCMINLLMMLELLGSMDAIVEVFINNQLQNLSDQLLGKTPPGTKLKIDIHVPKDGDIIPCGFLRQQKYGDSEAEFKVLNGEESKYDETLTKLSLKMIADEKGLVRYPSNQIKIIAQKDFKIKILQPAICYDSFLAYFNIDELIEAPLAKNEEGEIIIVSEGFGSWKNLIPSIQTYYAKLLPKLPVRQERRFSCPQYTPWSSLTKSQKQGGYAISSFFNHSRRLGALMMIDDNGIPDGRNVVFHAHSLMDKKGLRGLIKREKVYVSELKKNPKTGYAEAKRVFSNRPENYRCENINVHNEIPIVTLSDFIK